MGEPDATATVALLPADQGGRRAPTPDGWFGCVLVVAGQNHDVWMQLDMPLQRGSARRVGLKFLEPAAALPALSPGTVFSLWEGREIGFGRIEQVRGAHPIAAE